MTPTRLSRSVKFEFAIAKDGIADKHVVFESVDNWPIWTFVEDEGFSSATSAASAAETVRWHLAYVAACELSNNEDPCQAVIDAAALHLNILVSEWAQEFEWDLEGAFVSAVGTLVAEREVLPLLT